MTESSHDAFVRLANARTNKIISMVRLLGNLSNQTNYTWNDEELEKIFSTLRNELDDSQKRFKRHGKPGFKL